MLNSIVLMGRLTRDPELRHTPSSIPVATFTMAVERDISTQDGEKDTDFIDIVAWRGKAEFASKYFSKGQLIAVEGRLQVRPWTDRDGKGRKAYEVIAGSLYFAEGKKPGQEDSRTGRYYSGPNPLPQDTANDERQSALSEYQDFNDDDGELPF